MSESFRSHESGVRPITDHIGITEQRRYYKDRTELRYGAKIRSTADAEWQGNCILETEEQAILFAGLMYLGYTMNEIWSVLRIIEQGPPSESVRGKVNY